MIAALYVDPDGAYSGLEGVDAWGIERDARLYMGPHPVVAHPPCQRWGRYWGGGPNPRATRRELGADGGCFAAALAAVERFGGVLEHPEASHAWRAFNIAAPPRSGGWIRAGLMRKGWTCCVEQGHYGHPARKATWLYYVGDDPPALTWGPSSGQRLDEGFHSAEERRIARAAGAKPRPRLSTAENLATPIPFRDLLINIARTARKEEAA